jgi:hypothetical protein
MISDAETTKMKVVDPQKLYSFVVDTLPFNASNNQSTLGLL